MINSRHSALNVAVIQKVYAEAESFGFLPLFLFANNAYQFAILTSTDVFRESFV